MPEVIWIHLKYEMDQNKLKELIKAVAVIKDRKPKKLPSHRPAIEYITQTDDGGEEFQMPVEVTENPTLGFDLVKIKPISRLCELGCGDVVDNQVIERRFCSAPDKHWRTRCQSCGCYLSPDGKGFIDGAHTIYNAYVRYFNEIKGVSLPEKPVKPRHEPIVIETPNYTETVTNDNVIRVYK